MASADRSSGRIQTGIRQVPCPPERTDDSCLMTYIHNPITGSRSDYQSLPEDFCNCIMEVCPCYIQLVGLSGLSWPVVLQKFGGQYMFVGDGWITFCAENGVKNGDNLLLRRIRAHRFKLEVFKCRRGVHRLEAKTTTLPQAERVRRFAVYHRLALQNASYPNRAPPPTAPPATKVYEPGKKMRLI